MHEKHNNLIAEVLSVYVIAIVLLAVVVYPMCVGLNSFVVGDCSVFKYRPCFGFVSSRWDLAPQLRMNHISRFQSR